MHSLAGAGTGITGRVAEGQPPPWHGLEPILRMLAATIGLQSTRPVLQLSGIIGSQLLKMVLATKRLWIAPSGFTDTEVRTRALKSALLRRPSFCSSFKIAQSNLSSVSIMQPL